MIQRDALKGRTYSRAQSSGIVQAFSLVGLYRSGWWLLQKMVYPRLDVVPGEGDPSLASPSLPLAGESQDRSVGGLTGESQE
ncbi:MAG TPA: hypothetical protein VGP33_04935 [Chloroflexota bacterium]|nr:hypothetical protein [Chloroflexota bacterium]